MALTCRLLAATGRSRARSRRRRTRRCASLPPIAEPDLRRSTFSVFLRLADAFTRPQMSPYANNGHPVHLSSVFDPASLPQHPSSLFPTATSLARVLPPPADTALIIEHALESTGWHHACIHAPSFRAELAEFMTHPDEARFETASPAWLALLFAQLACGTKHMTREQLKQLGPFGLSDGASSHPPIVSSPQSVRLTRARTSCAQTTCARSPRRTSTPPSPACIARTSSRTTSCTRSRPSRSSSSGARTSRRATSSRCSSRRASPLSLFLFLGGARAREGDALYPLAAASASRKTSACTACRPRRRGSPRSRASRSRLAPRASSRTKRARGSSGP